MQLDNQLTINILQPTQIQSEFNKQKRIKIKFSLLLKIIFLKFFLQNRKILKKNNNFSDKSLAFSSTLKKNLNKNLKTSIFPLSNAFSLTINLLKKLLIYYNANLKLKKISFKVRKLKNKSFLKLAKLILKLKEILLKIKNLSFLFNIINGTKVDLFLLIKQQLLKIFKSKQLIISFFRGNSNYSTLVFLLRCLKTNKFKKNKNLKINLFYKKFVGLFTKKGEKRKSLKIINKALLTTSKIVKIPVNELLVKLQNKLTTSVEIKKVKIRRSFHFVPFPVNLKRRLYLIIKWFMFALSTFKEKKNLHYRLSEEILKVLKNQESIVNYSKKYQIQKSFKYQANTHFRW